MMEAVEGRLLLAAATGPFISEFLASNDEGLADQDGAHPDWVEIHNPTSTALNLQGYYLTDSATDLRKWQFPSTVVPSGGYLTVFASGKDRAVSGQELHTNFDLNARGEYLALVGPDGTTVVSSYGEAFPEQLVDISYGIATDYTATQLVGPGAVARTYVPTNASVGSGWTGSGFNDAGWKSGTTGVGFDRSAPPPRKSGFSVRMVNVVGAIGDIATAERLIGPTLPAGWVLQQDVTRDSLVVNHGPGGNYGGDLALPNGAAADDEYVLVATADVFIPAGTWSLAVGSDDGFKLTIPGVTFTNRQNENYQNMPQPIGADTLAYSALRGHAVTSGTVTIPAGGLSTRLTLIMNENGGGDDVELSVASGAQGYNGNFVLLSDGVLPGWQVKTTSSTPPPTYDALLGTNVEAEMYQRASGAYVRIPIGMVENPNDFDKLRLRVKYDDGFVAYVNGREIARRNAPDGTPLWSSSATASHDDALALVYEEIDIPLEPGLLVAGSTGNVLAIHALNRAAADDDFVIYPELIGIHTLSNVERYFTKPTPGGPNDNSSLVQIVGDTRFDHDRGFYTAAFPLAITTATEGATIRYTTDGSEPSMANGTTYSGPIQISKTTVLRAAAFKPGYRPSNVDTHTYLFLNDVIRQSATPAGFPTKWTGYSTDVVADYEMDPNVVNNPAYSAEMIDALKAVPTLSIVTSRDALFGKDGIYSNAGMGYRGISWERGGSIELINPDGTEGFQVDAGIRMYGNVGSEPSVQPKHTFRLRFDEDLYGTGKLKYPLFAKAMFGETATDSFDTVILRANFNNSFALVGGGATYLQDTWSNDTQLAMGQTASHTTFMHLYVDGLYWGLYAPTERPDQSFMSSYYGGDKADYDLNHEGEMINGDWNAWNTMMNLANAGLATQAAYDQFKQYVDVENLIDYLLLNFYGGNWDWDGHNWYSGRKREAGAGFQFFNWDGEGNLADVGANLTDQDRGPFTHMYLKLRENPEFRLEFADRVYKHLINSNGVLTDAKNQARWTQRVAEISKAIVAESARWGDTKQEPPATRADWQNQVNWRTTGFFPNHANTVVGWFRALGLYPTTPAPEFNQNGGVISQGFALTITRPGGQGTIYYTLDGSDPRLVGGAVFSKALAYTAPIPLDRTTVVKSRIRLADGAWSALHDATFTYNMAALRVTELMYHPQAGGAYTSNDLEFVELQNTGTFPLIMDNLEFTEGISFRFPDTAPDTVLAAGERMVLVKNQAAFQWRYGTSGIRIGGVYTRDLADNGERLTLVGPAKETIFSFEYDDDWYPITDWDPFTGRGGYSLVSINPTANPDAFSTKDNWRPSTALHGAPGSADPGFNPGSVVINEVMSNAASANGDWIELYNTTAASIDVGGWFLSTDPADLTRWRIPAGTMINPGGHVVLSQAVHFGGALDLLPQGGDLYLANSVNGNLGGYREHVDFAGAALEVTFGRYIKSTGGTDFTAMSAPTREAPNAMPLVGPVVISELMYHPVEGGDEFIEIQNLTGAVFPLYDNGNPDYAWQITDAVEYTFPRGTSLAPFGYALIVGVDPAAYRTAHGIPDEVPVFGPYTGTLSDDNDNVKLVRPGAVGATGLITVDQVHYDSSAPWISAADGSGPSLSRINASAYGNDAGNWVAGPPGGTPGVAFVPPSAPRDLTAYAATPSSIRLSWTRASTNEDGYRIERSADGLRYTQIGTAPAGATSFDDTSSLNSNTFYTYRALAYNAAGASPYSNAFTASTPSVVIVDLLSYTDNWKYNQARHDLEPNWMTAGYDDSGAEWLSGSGLFYWEDAPLPAPKTTPLDRGPDGDRTMTFYFRTKFRLDFDPASIFSMQYWVITDDGVAIYLNGNTTDYEALGMGSAPYAYATPASRGVGDATIEGPFDFKKPTLVRGDNIIAAEVHQNGSGSSDIVFGLAMRARIALGQVTADIVDVSPEPTLTPVKEMTIRFSEAVKNFDLTDLILTRSGGGNLLTPAQTLTTSDGGVTWTLGNLVGLTTQAGYYTLSLVAKGSGIGSKTSSRTISSDALESFRVLGSSIPGTMGSDKVTVRVNGPTLEVFTGDPATTPPTYTAPTSAMTALTVEGGEGNDTLRITTPLPFTPTFVGGNGTDRLVVEAGSFGYSANLVGYGIDELAVGGHGVVSLGATQHLAKLSAAGSGRVVVPAGGMRLLMLDDLSIAENGSVDLNDNALVVRTTSAARETMLAMVSAGIQSGRSGGTWTGPGLVSSAAKTASTTGLAAVINDRGDGTPIYPTLMGQALDANAVVVRYAMNGDADLNGTLDADDYFRVDRAALTHTAGWQSGDFDYSGAVDADDYQLADAAYAARPKGSAPAGRAVAAPETTTLFSTTLIQEKTVARKKPENEVWA